MRVAVISDIHGNIDAFKAVVEAAKDVEEWWCLGDVVGYGAAPNECMALLLSLPHVAIPGNHDWAAIGKLSAEDFNPEALSCVRWTGEVLQPEYVAYLSELPVTRVCHEFTLVHGSPRAPLEEYLLRAAEAEANIAFFTTPICLVGHTHRAALFTRDGMESHPTVYALPKGDSVKGMKALCNPGAVGQPRDGDPRAAYLMWDSETGKLTWHRVEYDVERAATRIIAAGLPTIEAVRLQLGS